MMSRFQIRLTYVAQRTGVSELLYSRLFKKPRGFSLFMTMIILKRDKVFY